MFQRPRLLAASLGLLLSACSLEVTYSDSHYACDDGTCPDGYTCSADKLCEPLIAPPDAAVEADAPIGALEIDGAIADPDAAPPPDATPPPPPDATPPPPPDAAPSPCTGSEDPQTGHCYTLVASSKSWASAKSSCEAQGLHLATITSFSEQLVVALLDNGSIAEAWIGANDLTSENDWRWVDNKDFPPSPSPNASSFENWNNGEPNNFNGNEDCALIKLTNNGVWDDRNCTQTLSSICERD